MTRRISIDLTDAADDEIKRLCESTGMRTADLFRHAISLMRVLEQHQSNHAVALLENGWKVAWKDGEKPIEWRSPRGISGEEWRSRSLDFPPENVLKDAAIHGDYQSR